MNLFSESLSNISRLPFIANLSPLRGGSLGEAFSTWTQGVSNTVLQKLPDILFRTSILEFNFRSTCSIPASALRFPAEVTYSYGDYNSKVWQEHKLVGNFRPLDFLYHTLKVFERFLQRRIYHFQRQYVLIPDNFEFREGYSSIKKLMGLVKTVSFSRYVNDVPKLSEVQLSLVAD